MKGPIAQACGELVLWGAKIPTGPRYRRFYRQVLHRTAQSVLSLARMAKIKIKKIGIPIWSHFKDRVWYCPNVVQGV